MVGRRKEKNRAGKGTGNIGARGRRKVVAFKKVIRDVFSEKLTLQQRSRGGKRGSPVDDGERTGQGTASVKP